MKHLKLIAIIAVILYFIKPIIVVLGVVSFAGVALAGIAYIVMQYLPKQQPKAKETIEISWTED